ncbi:MAG: MBL fold metallo-hydrolase [Planctomycetales bacterium]|nr:MBL fold metallo-hydrolase [Planctomycetales bacterium]
MKLHILGTAGYHPNERRHTTCLAIPELGLVFDAGTSMFRLRDLIATSELEIFLSHAHLDHIVGLTYLLDILHEKPVDKVRVHGLASKLKVVREQLFHPDVFPVEPPFDSVPLDDEVAVAGNGKLTHCPLVHPGGSVGYRIDWPDRSLAYITDTTARPDSDYIDFVKGVDVLVHECNFPDGFDDLAKLTGHSCTSHVANVADAASVGSLILIHMNPLEDSDDPIGIKTARDIFPNTRVANDGDIVEF